MVVFQWSIELYETLAIGYGDVLRGPNNVARQEFIHEFLKFGPPDAHGKLQAALSSLLDAKEPSIDPFLRQIESSVLGSAQGRDVKDREEAFHKAFLTCLTLAKRPGDTVVSEYLVKYEPGLKDGPAVEIVYHSSSEIGKKRFAFGLKNVPVEFWKDMPYGNSVPWSQLVDTARTVMHKSEAEVCNLQYWWSEDGCYISVQKTINDASAQLRGYLNAMKKQDQAEGPSIGFVIVRVGLFRLISRRVTIQ